ncbi:MAG: tRNA(Arg) A34 adenosine deaminase TadA [Lysobacterales bacterium]|jgi:tRNA(Arg) A34 adenosine deaminase TadA
MSLSHQCQISLPSWVEGFVDGHTSNTFGTQEGMEFAISLAMENIRHASGGPFAAAVIDSDSGKLVSVGVNLVTTSGLSMAHAEMVAISLAQESLGQWNLSLAGNLSLFTTCEPCAMCFGAIPWSGVQRLICGAGKSDAEAAGFDEGEKPGNWVQTLQDRNIEVELNVLRNQAAGIFTLYREADGEIYNAGPTK